jgi:hypothetical protein
MTDGNTARVMPGAQEETRERDGADAPAHASSVPSGNDMVSRAIAEGLMVLPDDDGLPPLLKKKMNPLSQQRPARHTRPSASDEVHAREVRPEVAAPPQSVSMPQEAARHSGAVVTPHPAVFRSQATPLAIHPAPRSAPPMPAGAGQSAQEAARETDHGSEGGSAMSMTSIPQERLKPAPPPLQAVKDTIPVVPGSEEAAVATTPAQPERLAAQPAQEVPPQPEPMHQAAPIPTAPVPQPHVADHAYYQAAQQPQFAPPQYQQQQVPPAYPPSYAQPQFMQPQYAPPPAYPYPPQGFLLQGFPAQQYYPQQWQQPAHYPVAPVACPPPAPQAAYAAPPVAPACSQQDAAAQKEAASGAQLLSGLLQYLPPPGQFWSDAERKNWLEAAATLFDLAYGNLDPSNRDPSTRGQPLSRTNHRLRDR